MPSIRNFLDSFSQSEVARSNRFDVNIIVPPGLLQYKSQLNGGLTLRCENANLPGRTFGTVDQKFGSNPTQKFPMHASYEDITFSFIISGDMQERTFFDIWMEFINPTKTFDFAYKQDYSSTIIVYQYDQYDKMTYSVSLYNAYPISINQMDLDWSTDTPHKLSVVFAYDYRQLQGIENLYGDLNYAKLTQSGFQASSGTLSTGRLGPLATVTQSIAVAPTPAPVPPAPAAAPQKPTNKKVSTGSTGTTTIQLNENGQSTKVYAETPGGAFIGGSSIR